MLPLKPGVLRLARLLSYNATRNQCANGLLKVVAVSTSENVIDSNNLNLNGTLNEVIITNRVLTETERTHIFHYLSKKWNMKP